MIIPTSESRRPVRMLLVLFGMLIVFATPTHADPDTGAADADFLAALRSAGITYTDPLQAVSAGQSVCGMMERGVPGLQILADLKATNPGIDTDGAAQFAVVAARFYCPHHLQPG